jgi:hypothetical protein
MRLEAEDADIEGCRSGRVQGADPDVIQSLDGDHGEFPFDMSFG